MEGDQAEVGSHAGSEGIDAGRHDDVSHVHEREHERLAYGMSLLFAMLGATLLSFGRLKDERIPHDPPGSWLAAIGEIYIAFLLKQVR